MANIDVLATLPAARAVTRNTPGTCLGVVYAGFGSVQSIGPGAGHFARAIDAWDYAAEKHVGDRNPPIGVPVYFGVSPTRTDKNAGAGDVARSIGGGLLFVTDVAGATGRTGIMTIAAREKETARPYLGWTADFLGHQLVNIGQVAATPSFASLGFSQDVKNRQDFLNATFNAGLVSDGKLGPKTKTAIAAYQRVLGLTPDGDWGPLTAAAHARYVAAHAPHPAPAAAHAVLRRGSTGPAVKQLQETLNAKFPAYSHLVADSSYGPATEAVVRQLQTRAHLAVDGAAGPQVFGYLGI